MTTQRNPAASPADGEQEIDMCAKGINLIGLLHFFIFVAVDCVPQLSQLISSCTVAAANYDGINMLLNQVNKNMKESNGYLYTLAGVFSLHSLNIYFYLKIIYVYAS